MRTRRFCYRNRSSKSCVLPVWISRFLIGCRGYGSSNDAFPDPSGACSRSVSFSFLKTSVLIHFFFYFLFTFQTFFHIQLILPAYSTPVLVVQGSQTAVSPRLLILDVIVVAGGTVVGDRFFYDDNVETLMSFMLDLRRLSRHEVVIKTGLHEYWRSDLLREISRATSIVSPIARLKLSSSDLPFPASWNVV